MRTLTAPLGWNSWDCYGPTVTEDIVRQNADFMAKHLKQFGWEYIVVDIQWYQPSAFKFRYEPFADLNMDEYSRLIPAENRFPSSAGGKGFAPLAEYVHSLGLKFGIHIMRGIPRQAAHRNTKIYGCDKTAREIAMSKSICHWNPDMYGVDPHKEGAKEYYDSIFKLYASWGVDYVKVDDIAREFPHAEEELIMLADSLHNCGRDMILSLSPGPAPLDKAELFKEIANMWRITDDFWDDWELLYAMFERAEKWSIHTGAGHWPDADMLPIGPIRLPRDPEGWTRFTQDEQKTMMTLWSIFRSPLIIGGEMTGFDDFTMSLLTNEELLKMHRNARHSHQVFRKEVCGSELILWTAASAEGGSYLALFNAGNEDKEFCVDLTEAEIYSDIEGVDIWTKEAFSSTTELKVTIPAHGAAAYYLK